MNNNYGGKRKGSGRKKLSEDQKKIPVSYKLPKYIIEFLRENKRITGKSAAQTIEEALEQCYDVRQGNIDL